MELLPAQSVRQVTAAPQLDRLSALKEHLLQQEHLRVHPANLVSTRTWMEQLPVRNVKQVLAAPRLDKRSVPKELSLLQELRYVRIVLRDSTLMKKDQHPV